MTQSPSLAVLDSEEPTVQPLGLQRLRRSISGLVGNPMARQGALSLVDQTISSATNFVTSVIIGRLASREALGLYVLALSIVYLVRSVQDQIIAIPYRTYCHRRQGRSLAAYTGSILVHQFALSAAAMLLLGIVLVLTPRTLISANFARALWGVLGALPFLLARDCVRQVAFAQLRLTAAIVQDLAVCILQIGALLTLGFLHMLSVATVYLVLGTVAALVVAGWFALQHR